MYIHRLVIKNFRAIRDLDVTFHNDWTDQPLQRALFLGPNGSGKTTILRVISYLWESFPLWIQARKSNIFTEKAFEPLAFFNDLDADEGVAAIEIYGLTDQPVWFYRTVRKDLTSFFPEILETNSSFIGYQGFIHGKNPPIVGFGSNINISDETAIADIYTKYQQLQAGATIPPLPNILFLQADSRMILTPPNTVAEPYTEPLYQWLVTYEARDRWEGHLESMLRNLKLRDTNRFQEILAQLSQFLGDKFIGDFNERLRLPIQRNYGNPHYLEDLGAGEQQALILMFMVSRWLTKGGIVLIDEPDLHLHVSLQRHLLRELSRLIVDEMGGQLIVTSHSPTLWEDFNHREIIQLGAPEHAS
jgi:ABC-type transport system involved in cytochrome c biogenesis ATPase subunit